MVLSLSLAGQMLCVVVLPSRVVASMPVCPDVLRLNGGDNLAANHPASTQPQSPGAACQAELHCRGLAVRMEGLTGRVSSPDKIRQRHQEMEQGGWTSGWMPPRGDVGVGSGEMSALGAVGVLDADSHVRSALHSSSSDGLIHH